MSLGHKDKLIHTAIGSEKKVIHEMKISLLDNRGVVQNVKAQGADKDIGPDKLNDTKWYDKAFQ